MTPNMLTSVLTTLIAAGVCAAALAPYAVEWLFTRRGTSRLRLAERRIEEQQAGFVHGAGPVQRATPWDMLEAEHRLARTAWRARIIARQRDCRERREARRALRRQASPVRHPRHCTPPAPPADWWPRFPKPTPRPAGMTPHQAIVAELRGTL